MTENYFTGIALAPHVPGTVLWFLGAAALVLVALSFLFGARGGWARALAFLVLIAALANPLIVRETREPLSDVVALITDRSQSQTIGTRSRDAERARTRILEQLQKLKNVEVREADVRTRADEGTTLFQSAGTALADVPPDRVGAVIAITDGQVHDAPNIASYNRRAPFQVLLTGAPGERDRKLSIARAARFAIVGQDAQLAVRVDDFGGPGGNVAHVRTRVDGEERGSQLVPTGETATIAVPIAHGGENVIEVEAAPGPAEQTLQNNRAVVVVTGVRDRLRVLLISGQPHAGERVWRNLLKADPSVDLVHFTILRPPEKQDAIPINELSLIAFPTRELFDEKLDQFDLVIFDRFSRQGILPLAYFENLARYVEDGGGLLVSSGPELVAPESIYRTPLAAVLPAQPTGEVITQGFTPEVTKQGFAHPVTQGLTGANSGNAPPKWGRWYRMMGTQRLAGVAVMAGAGRPLLVLDRIRQGRVAQLLSDQPWLWARGFEGGGPQAELLRRLAHWLMKEPDLEEERLQAQIAGGEMTITRRTMAAEPAPVNVQTPSGRSESVTLSQARPGQFTARMRAGELGLYRLSDGKLSAIVAAGTLNPREVADMRATAEILKPYAEKTRGAVHWLRDGIPDVREVDDGREASGKGWIGIARRNAYRVSAVEQEPLLPPWLALVLLLGTVLLAWRLEGR
ncbi:MAG: hypothetical protein ACT4OG_07125 [Alphaproteobacteria bacterium]